MEIAIIGGGIGGLTTALWLHKKGLKAKVYEAVPEVKPLGVGVAIQPYGTREITELGLLDRFEKISVEALDSMHYNHYGQEIYGERCGKHIGYEHAQRMVHRGTFQMMLYEAVLERLGPDSVVSGARLKGLEQDADGVTLFFEPGKGAPESARADIVIGADGIKSVVCQLLHPDLSKPKYSGITLWRGVTYMKPYRKGGTVLHIGAPSVGSMIVYPILNNATPDGLTLTNWVVEQNGLTENIEDWNHRVKVDAIAHMFDTVKLDFIDVGAMMRAAHEVYIFPLIDHDPLDRWSFGRVTLLGDAAHAMYPRAGNGACQALVDARVIAEKLTEIKDPVAALKAYEDERRDKVNKLVMANRGEGLGIIRRLVDQRTNNQPFDDIEKVLPFKEADDIFKYYHGLAGMKRPAGKEGEASGFRTPV